jgi:exodeoxyribonuclease-5
MHLTFEQEYAVTTLAESNESELSLAGPAGSGKTTLIKALADAFDDVEICTPTNKAAFVLRTKGLDANTIFKIFFIPEIVENIGPNGQVVSKWLKFTPANEYCKGPLPLGKRSWCDVVIVDEASMIPTWIVAKMRRMAGKLILVGDPHQLPPVRDKAVPGGYFNTRVHDCVLTTIHRQAEGSAILELATAIRNESSKVVGHANSFRPERSFEDLFHDDYQFIAFTNKERARINFLCRQLLGRPDILPVPGDLMLSTDNFSDTIINGTPLTCVDFQWADRGCEVANITVQLEDGKVEKHTMSMNGFLRDQLVSQAKAFGPVTERRQKQADATSITAPIVERRHAAPTRLSLTYSYCLTAHKAQGSEFDKVCVIDQRNVIKLMTAAAIERGEDSLSPEEMARRWIYTAVTRAKKELAIAGTWWAVLSLDEALAA